MPPKKRSRKNGGPREEVEPFSTSSPEFEDLVSTDDDIISTSIRFTPAQENLRGRNNSYNFQSVPNPVRCTLLWSNIDNSDSQNLSIAYKPKVLKEEAAILLEEDVIAINKDITRLFPKSSFDCCQLLKTCLICDENTTAGVNPNQVNLIDVDLVPSLLDSEHFEGTGVFILHHVLLLDKTSSQQCAIVSKIINEASQYTIANNCRVVIYIPRLERFWGSLDSSIKYEIEEIILQASSKPILIISTTCWVKDTLPKELDKIFKGCASSLHVIGFPSPQKISTLLEKVLPGHKIFKINENQHEIINKMLQVINDFELPPIFNKAVSAATGKTASVILSLYYVLKMHCDLQERNWNRMELEYSNILLYFLLGRLKDVIGSM